MNIKNDRGEIPKMGRLVKCFREWYPSEKARETWESIFDTREDIRIGRRMVDTDWNSDTKDDENTNTIYEWQDERTEAKWADSTVVRWEELTIDLYD